MKITFFLLLPLVALISCQSNKLPRVLVNTSLGKIVLEIDTIKAPVTAFNFIKHIEKGTYSDASFYRTVRMNNQPNNAIKIEVIQGGLFSEKKIAGNKQIIHESTNITGLTHLDGTLSMAREVPGSASSEFFICINKQPELDFGGKRNPDGQGFAAFGTVVDGMEVVRMIQQQADQEQYLIEPVKITNIKMIN